ncbi:MAG: FHA domain-containing protein [Myxococcaceae bacterium]
MKLIIEDDEGRKTVVPFAQGEITIGREDGNTVRLTERNVSRRHARLRLGNGHVLVEDLGSANGILVNGDRISGNARLTDRDLLEIGDYDLAIEQEEVSAPAPSNTTAPAALAPAAASPANAYEKFQTTSIIRVDEVSAREREPVEEIDAQSAPRLIIMTGPLAGREFTCLRTKLHIGRVVDNDIAIDHRSLSRTHAKLTRAQTGEWRIVDLQSANGLSVNGESYGHATLRFGDTLELGHVKLRFLGPEGASESFISQLHQLKSRRKFWGALAVITSSTALLVAALVLWPRPQSTKSTSADEVMAVAVPDLVNVLPTVPEPNVVAVPPPPSDTPVAAATPPPPRVLPPRKPPPIPVGATAPSVVAPSPAVAVPPIVATPSSSPPGVAERPRPRAPLARAPVRPNEPLRPRETPAPLPADEALALLNDGRALVKQGKLKEAEAVFQKCLSTAPQHARCHMMLGSTYAQMRMLERGAFHYRRFLELAPNDPNSPRVKELLEKYDESVTQPEG